MLRDAVPVCAGGVLGASAAVVMTLDVAKVAVKQLSARNAVSETRAQTEWFSVSIKLFFSSKLSVWSKLQVF